uniref:ferroxidase n=1 Tax=Pygocentrus nattereri TaxID=42514 RepID=A0A3B4EIB4_PYGNA
MTLTLTDPLCCISCYRHASVFLLQGLHRIGHVYKKAMFRQYTDGSYTKEIPKPAWLGYLGPVLRAEVGDVIEIHLKNFASRSYSMHPHGVFYKKNSEGALYPDGTSGALKQDDGVPPGGTHTYTWTVKPEYTPTEGDSNCLTWAYHSHVVASRDISSGLIGALLTCKKDSLRNQKWTDVDQDFLLMFSVVDENLSWYLEENIQTFCSDPTGVDPNDPDFQRSNKMNAINGYVYGNLPGIELCQNRTVSWHLLGMGNEVDVHSAYFHGHTLLMRGHRVDAVSLFPATFLTAEMTPVETGTWLLNCQVNNGMQALFRVSPCGLQDDSQAPLNGTVREYFIAAELVQWNYAPSGMDTLTNVSLTESQSPSEVFFGTRGGRLGGKYRKAVFRAYTDHTFTSMKEQTSMETHLGILGPVLRAEVGDILLVTFLNNADRNYSMQPHGLQYGKEFEGAEYGSPFPLFKYYPGTVKNGSHVQPGDSFTYRWQVREGPSESDPPCISYLYYSSSDPIRDTNTGLIGPLLVCKRGALSSNMTQDIVVSQCVKSVIQCLTMWITRLFEVSCRVSEHYMGGMRLQYRVKRCRESLSAPITAPTGHYFIAAEEVEWDYSPERAELHNQNMSSIFVGKGENRLGSKYKKVVYREYTDATFRTRKQQQPAEKHLEILGPIIRAEVGEVLQITFLNKATRPYSVQPHGVKTIPTHPQPVLPGNMSRYQWIVPERSGPGISDPNCISFAYYSAVDFIKDTVSGLIGPLVICRKGTLNWDRQRLDIDREFALLFFIFDENKSWYLEQNIKTYYNNSLPLLRDGDFEESNKMHAINGKLYGNLHGLDMQKGERVNWYLLGMGSEVDMHTVHLHGQTFIYRVGHLLKIKIRSRCYDQKNMQVSL